MDIDFLSGGHSSKPSLKKTVGCRTRQPLCGIKFIINRTGGKPSIFSADVRANINQYHEFGVFIALL